LRDARRKTTRRKVVGLKKRQLREECCSHIQEIFLLKHKHKHKQIVNNSVYVAQQPPLTGEGFSAVRARRKSKRINLSPLIFFRVLKEEEKIQS